MNFLRSSVLLATTAAAFFAPAFALAADTAPAAKPATERIVSLGAPVTETVYAIGAGASVVARDLSSVYPREAAAKPQVGYFRTISAEGVLAQNPTLILAAFGTGPEPQVNLLKNSGVRFVHVDSKPSAESTIAMVNEIGKATGHTAEATALSEKLRGQFAEAAAIAKASGKKPKAVFLMSVSGAAIQAAGDRTAATALIELAGGTNALSGFSGYKAVTPEAILELDPDFIFYADKLQGSEDSAVSLDNPPAWLASTRAFKAGNVKGLSMVYHLVFGPRVGEAVLDVSRQLHAK